MFSNNKWIRLRILLALIVLSGMLAACETVNWQNEPSLDLSSPTAIFEVSSSTSTIHPSVLAPGATSKPTIPVELTPILTKAPESTQKPEAPTATVQIHFLEPMITAPLILFDGWSPDGETFAFWTFAGQQLPDYSYPPGTLHFWVTDTGQVCKYPFEVNYLPDRGSLVAWKMDGKAAVLSGDPPREGTPCKDDFVPTANLPIPMTDSLSDSFSPGGSYQVETKILDYDNFVAETSIFAAKTGRVVEIVQWRFYDAEGGLGTGGEWLSDDLFLIRQTLDQGPLLVEVGKGVIQVVPDLFHQTVEKCEPYPCEMRLTADGTLEDENPYHLVLFGRGDESEFPLVQLYHSESGEVETLPFRKYGGFSPNGQWLVLYEETWDEDKYRAIYKIALRAVDPVGSETYPLMDTDANPFPLAWSPDNTHIAINSSSGVALFSLADRIQLGFWETGNFEPLYGVWSPDGKFLALSGPTPYPSSSYALFILQLPEK